MYFIELGKSSSGQGKRAKNSSKIQGNSKPVLTTETEGSDVGLLSMLAAAQEASALEDK
jgi:hypothetical protein